MGGSGGADLVIFALPGVQRFIAEARSTGDVRAASEVFVKLAARVAEICGDAGGELVFPSGVAGEDGMPNRVVALLPAGAGARAAQDAQVAIEQEWRDWVRRALGLAVGSTAPATPGFPAAQWVCVPAGRGGYAEQWAEAQRLLAARRRVRDFGAVEWARRDLCSLGPRWPAEPEPPGLREHEKAELSAAGWVKRRWRKVHAKTEDLAGFPSTASIASAPFRRAVLSHFDDEEIKAAIGQLARAAQQVIRAGQGADVRETRISGLAEPDGEPGKWFASTGGPWVYAYQWQVDSLAREMKTDPATIGPAAASGLEATIRLHNLMKRRGIASPAAYLAVIAADIDNMGRFLGGAAASAGGTRIGLNPAEHKNVSEGLAAARR